VAHIKRNVTLELIETHRESEAWDELKKVIHSLKGAGASFGHPLITEHAKATEQALLNNDYSTLSTELEQLLETIKRSLK
jgi:HPt (histidine-containing phosphotransfer) domain-containing protein